MSETYDERIERLLDKIAKFDAELLFETTNAREVWVRKNIERLYREVARLEEEERNLGSGEEK